ncbi:oxygen-independent coproporphyrinogen III oxidase [Ferrimonas lipolytica]|uniref:Coproporphyrinogen-III oxidase n=1 Tax=Ferrimonas lipolytica TaxID=2724191 RepID=A0A6H1UGP8_9GAMM|nr:oxygen-independent coproporphyrinogen III oxidase [Ferrimonas lipolytica]QIZ78277.1 oxygen-independent coproporphyrinogen III oxidase [Ferrimonas lipolytica]
MQDKISWNQALIEKYNYSGPRYTSYPTAVEFHKEFSENDLAQAIVGSDKQNLSLYIHVPFCHKLCYYCGCNKIITRHAHKADQYLDYLEREIKARAPHFQQYNVTQMHWGGGTPTFLNPEQIRRLTNLLKEQFNFADEGEFSIEIDPREIEISTLDVLAEVGFNRISVGVQDFNKKVQQAVNREQDEQFIFDLLKAAKEKGFSSTNVDLIYGLPHQTPESFNETLERIKALAPDRLSVFNYAHLPHRFAAQRKIHDEDLPTPMQKLKILENSINILTEDGYQFIGMDHFAKPDDELAKLQRAGKLHRNFQGYTTQPDADLLGLGASAISSIGNAYAQNAVDLKDYYNTIDAQGTALIKGCSLERDDFIRRAVIKQLICHFEMDKTVIEQEWDINFDEYFATDIELLKPFIDDELVQHEGNIIRVTATGNLLIRNICMCFDRYMREKARQQQFSRVI